MISSNSAALSLAGKVTVYVIGDGESAMTAAPLFLVIRFSLLCGDSVTLLETDATPLGFRSRTLEVAGRLARPSQPEPA